MRERERNHNNLELTAKQISRTILFIVKLKGRTECTKDLLQTYIRTGLKPNFALTMEKNGLNLK